MSRSACKHLCWTLLDNRQRAIPPSEIVDEFRKLNEDIATLCRVHGGGEDGEEAWQLSEVNAQLVRHIFAPLHPLLGDPKSNILRTKYTHLALVEKGM